MGDNDSNNPDKGANPPTSQPDPALVEIQAKLKERGFDSVDDLLADRDKLGEDRDNYKDQNENAQKLIQRQGAELGDLRKGVPHKPAQGDNQTTDKSKPADKEETLEELEASLSDEQKAAADEAYAKATPEEKIQFVENPEARKKLLLTAKALVTSVPESLFSKPSASPIAPSADEERIRALFEQQKDESTFLPAVPGQGPATKRTPKDDTSEVKPRPVGGNGVLSSINTRRQLAKT